MGRKRSINLDLPPKVRRKTRSSGKVYFYYDTGGEPRKEIPLGSDYAMMLKQWEKLHIQKQVIHVITFKHVTDRYEREVIPTKAPSTQKTNEDCLRRLLEFFNNPPAPLDDIKPVHVRKYMDFRKGIPVAANKDKALFHHIWKKAVNWGYTEKPNPAAGIEGFKEKGRDRYVEDEEFEKVYKLADEPTRDAMDMAYLTGQRPADVLKLMETDIKDGCLLITQNKTGKKLRMAVTGELQELITRIMARKSQYRVRSLALICNEQGQRLTYGAFVWRWKKVRKLAKVNFQFRDLRAKAATDKSESGDDYRAQKQLGHENVSMTKAYIRNRKGDKVDPTK